MQGKDNNKEKIMGFICTQCSYVKESYDQHMIKVHPDIAIKAVELTPVEIKAALDKRYE